MGTRSLPVFITMAGILTAALLVWAQLWGTVPGVGAISSPHHGSAANDRTLALGLAWTYLSGLLALISLALAAHEGLVGRLTGSQDAAVGRWPLFFLVAAVLLALANVLQAILSPILFLATGENLADWAARFRFSALTLVAGIYLMGSLVTAFLYARQLVRRTP